jgi:hypothetical protein
MSSVLDSRRRRAYFDIESPLFQISFQDLDLGSLVELLCVSGDQLYEEEVSPADIPLPVIPRRTDFGCEKSIDHCCLSQTGLA